MVGSCTPEKEWFEDNLKITKLLELSTKCKHKKEKTLWCLEWMYDRLSAGMMEVGELSIQAIKIRHPGNQKALVDLALCKFDAKQYLTGKFLDAKNIRPDCKEQLRKLCGNYTEYRKVKPLVQPDEDDGRLTFLTFWPKSAQLAFELVEGAVFQHNGSDESVFRIGLRNNKSPQETLEDWFELYVSVSRPLKSKLSLIDLTL